MMNKKAFSLIEVMVVLMITSIIVGIVYQLISIGVRFFENFSKVSDFSIKNITRDIELELDRSYDFSIVSNTLWIFQDNKTIKYSPFKIEKDLSHLTVKKDIIQDNKVITKMFKLNNVISITFFKHNKDGNKKLFLLIQDTKGKKIYEGYLP